MKLRALKPGMLRRSAGCLADQGGATTVEYLLLIALIALPSVYLLRLLLAVMSAHYHMVVFLETLPLP